jgi:hypothetical protein
MLAKETYKLLRTIVGPWCRERGFRSVKSSYLKYVRESEQNPVILEWQCHHHGWEKHKGSKFTVWLRRGEATEFGSRISDRLTSHLTLQDLEFIRARQNKIVASIPQPPVSYVNDIIHGFERAFRDPAPMIASYLSDWQLVETPYLPTDNIWFRYFSEEDVRAWALVLLRYIDPLVANTDGPNYSFKATPLRGAP